MSKKFILPVTWEVFGEIEVEADSLEQAVREFCPEDYAPPWRSHYVDGSFRLTTEDPEEIRAMFGEPLDDEDIT